jgi:hypothetical protein
MQPYVIFPKESMVRGASNTRGADMLMFSITKGLRPKRYMPSDVLNVRDVVRRKRDPEARLLLREGKTVKIYVLDGTINLTMMFRMFSGRERDLEARLRGARKVSSELTRDNSIKQDILTNSQTVTKGLEMKLREAETKLLEAEAKLREADKNGAETERLRNGEVLKSQDLIKSLEAKLEKAMIHRKDVERLLAEAANAQAVAKSFQGKLEAARKERKELEEELEKAAEGLASALSQKAELQRSLKVRVRPMSLSLRTFMF